jgi:hypothetical protein
MTGQYPQTRITPAEAISRGYTHCTIGDGDVYTIQQVDGWLVNADDATRAFLCDFYYLLEPNLVNPSISDHDIDYLVNEFCNVTSHPDEREVQFLAGPWLREKVGALVAEFNEVLKTGFSYHPDTDIYLDFTKESEKNDDATASA